MFTLVWQLHPQSYGKSKRGKAGIDCLIPRSSSAYLAGRSSRRAEQGSRRRGSKQEGAGQQPDWMALEGSRGIMVEGSKVKANTQRRWKESNKPSSARRWIGVCAVQGAARLLHWKAVLQRRDNLVRTVGRRKICFQAYCLVCQLYQM